jgi:hypothetical protein
MNGISFGFGDDANKNAMRKTAPPAFSVGIVHMLRRDAAAVRYIGADKFWCVDAWCFFVSLNSEAWNFHVDKLRTRCDCQSEIPRIGAKNIHFEIDFPSTRTLFNVHYA